MSVLNRWDIVCASSGKDVSKYINGHGLSLNADSRRNIMLILYSTPEECAYRGAPLSKNILASIQQFPLPFLSLPASVASEAS